MSDPQKSNLMRSLKASVVGGIVAGIVFGILMQMMGKMPMIAGMMGSQSIAVGWMIHMVISIVFGAAFGMMATNIKKVYLFGIVYGVMIWIVGPLLMMPLMMGMGTSLAAAFTPPQLMNLATHIMFALILSFVYQKNLRGGKVTASKNVSQ
ncbi:DUF1440 domain-containing protein [Pseudalkalibacillus decolorationis]|uniref:DUF1440 domain-containing protein n=1 Tax=Pseudalkalibacillus decolorationis TaxID=163879 RepID=UPI002148080F|nr:DUF1440 domain-containing protein [Pseudalkalibacillus decolorationis]